MLLSNTLTLMEKLGKEIEDETEKQTFLSPLSV